MREALHRTYTLHLFQAICSGMVRDLFEIIMINGTVSPVITITIGIPFVSDSGAAVLPNDKPHRIV